MRGTQFIIEALRKEKVEHLFLGPEAKGIDHFYSEMSHAKGMTSIVATHEAGAVFMADGYARAKGRFGVCFVIGEPKVTTLADALATASADQSPLLLITGRASADRSAGWQRIERFQDSFSKRGQDHFVLNSVTRFSSFIEDPCLLKQDFQEAMEYMLGICPGPVHLSIAEDVQKADISSSLGSITDFYENVRYFDLSALNKMMKVLQGATKTVILVGAGIEQGNATKELLKFSEKFAIPVATTLRAKGAFPEDHSLSLGVLEPQGSLQAHHAILEKETDALVIIGSGLTERDIFLWDRKIRKCRTLIQIDKNPEKIGNAFIADYPIIGHPESILRWLIEKEFDVQETKNVRQKWISAIKELPRQDDLENAASEAIPIHPARLFDELRKSMPRETLLVVDSYLHRAFVGRYWESYFPRHYLSATSLTTPRGWAVSAAIGAKIARPELPCVVLTDDQSMQMQGFELQATVRYNVSIIYIVIRHRAMDLAYTNQTPLREWGSFAKALGIEKFYIDKPKDFSKTFQKALWLQKTCIIHVCCSRNSKTSIIPFIADSKNSSWVKKVF